MTSAHATVVAMSTPQPHDEPAGEQTIVDSGDIQRNGTVHAVAKKIEILRGSIDNVDMAIIALLAERFKYTTSVGALKAKAGFAPADYKREDEQMRRLRRLAIDAGLDPEIAEEYREFVVTEAKKRHKRIAETGEDPGVLDIFA